MNSPHRKRPVLFFERALPMGFLFPGAVKNPFGIHFLPGLPGFIAVSEDPYPLNLHILRELQKPPHRLLLGISPVNSEPESFESQGFGGDEHVLQSGGTVLKPSQTSLGIPPEDPRRPLWQERPVHRENPGEAPPPAGPEVRAPPSTRKRQGCRLFALGAAQAQARRASRLEGSTGCLVRKLRMLRRARIVWMT